MVCSRYDGREETRGAYVLLYESQQLKQIQFVCREVNASIVATSRRFSN